MVGTVASQVRLRLRICMVVIYQGVLVPVLPVWSVPKTSSPYDGAHAQVPVFRRWFPALHLVNRPEPLQRAGDYIEKRMVLDHLRPGSVMNSCVPGVHVDCIAAGPPHCPVLLNPDIVSSNAHDLRCGYTRSKAVGRARRHAVVPVP